MSVINRKVIPNNVNDDLVNEKIRFKEVLVINSDGEQLGIKMRREALDIAFDQGLDLLCVAPKATPPVCKVLDYGKYRFEQQKKAKEAKKKQHVTEVKPLENFYPAEEYHQYYLDKNPTGYCHINLFDAEEFIRENGLEN